MNDFKVKTGEKKRSEAKNTPRSSVRRTTSRQRTSNANRSQSDFGMKICIFVILGCVLLNTFLACLNEYRIQKMSYEMQKAAEKLKSDFKDLERATESLR